MRRIYHGPLVYTANWSGEFERVAFRGALDYVGVQAYVPLSGEAEASNRAYEAASRALWSQPWCAGFYWWKWFPAGHPEAEGRDFYFTPQGKPAAAVLRRMYGAE